MSFRNTNTVRVLVVIFAACAPPDAPPTEELAVESAGVLVGAGDIASCDSRGDEATAALLQNIDGTVFTTGDNVYSSGKLSEFRNCYEPSWGRHKHRTRPSPGNHDHKTSGAAGYFAYFGNAAGPKGRGYYSYQLADWHIIVLDSELHRDGDDDQMKWLRQDLASHRSTCTLAYWHHPRFNSGVEHGNAEDMEDLWQILYDAGADVVLAGHEHTYERFAPQTPQGKADPRRGIRQFVVGTGGKELYEFASPQPNSEFRYNDEFGVLKLVLHPRSYDWEFINTARDVIDRGTGNCH